MRKKKLINYSAEINRKLEIAEERINTLISEIKERDAEISNLKMDNERLSSKLNATPPMKNLEAKVIKHGELSDDVDYGASVIGRIVVEAAKHCNSLTEFDNSEETKELVNLILGRTEVAKAEILKVVSSNDNVELKKEKVDAVFAAAVDYFKSIMAQNR